MIAVWFWLFIVFFLSTFFVLSDLQNSSSSADFMPTVTVKLEGVCQKPNVLCSNLPAECLSCEWPQDCVYGADVSVKCKASADSLCVGDRNNMPARQAQCL